MHGNLTFLILEHDMAFMSVLSLAVGTNPDSHVGVEWCSIQNNAIEVWMGYTAIGGERHREIQN
jgi:hypothetical protein